MKVRETMAYSDKKLVEKAKRRYDILKKKGVQSDVLTQLETNIDVFYSRKGRKKTSKSGISLKKSFDTQSRKEMRSILRTFLKNPLSKIIKVADKFNNLLSSYKKIVSPDYFDKMTNNIGTKEQSQLMERMVHAVQHQKFLESLGSDVLNELYNSHVKPLNLNTRTIIKAFENVTNNFTQEELNELSNYERVDVILSEYDKIVNESGV